MNVCYAEHPIGRKLGRGPGALSSRRLYELRVCCSYVADEGKCTTVDCERQDAKRRGISTTRSIPLDRGVPFRNMLDFNRIMEGSPQDRRSVHYRGDEFADLICIRCKSASFDGDGASSRSRRKKQRERKLGYWRRVVIYACGFGVPYTSIPHLLHKEYCSSPFGGVRPV